MLRITVAAAAMLSLAAQNARPQAVLENDHMRLELIGLKRWTIPMIQDSLRRQAPELSLLSNACAAILREKLKFADASAVHYTTIRDGKATKPYVAVTVVEPQDSALVRYRGPFRDSLPDHPAWGVVRDLFERDRRSFEHALMRPDFLLGDGPFNDADSAQRRAPPLPIPLRAFLQAHRAPSDRELALTTLAQDGNWRNRMAAVVILANFAHEDSAWWALADALRDPVGFVSGSAEQLLRSLRHAATRRVDWGPATGTLRAILDGTNLFAHDDLMELLAATQVDPALARPLLKDGAYLVLAKLRSQGDREHEAARRFLVQIAGRDLGNDPVAWEEWVRGL